MTQDLSQRLVATGALLGFLAVGFGAFGAHALKAQLSPEMLTIFETAVRYQMYHALALLLLGLWSAQTHARSAQRTGVLFVLGIFIFSGSLYILTLSGVRTWGAVTPLGGLCLLIAWLHWAWQALKVSKTPELNQPS